MHDLEAQRAQPVINAAGCQIENARQTADDLSVVVPRTLGCSVKISELTRGLLAVLALDTVWVVGVAVMLLALSTLFQ